jgi:hypothetical protein
MYPPSETEIFVYRTGTREVRGDPLAIDRRLFLAAGDAGEDLDNLLGLIRGPRPPDGRPAEMGPDQVRAAYDAIGRLLPIIRESFRVTSIEEDLERGLTEGDTLRLLDEFLRYKFDLQGEAGRSPGSSPPTVSRQEASGPVAARASGRRGSTTGRSSG